MVWNDGLQGVALEIAQTDRTPLRVTAGPGTGKSFAMKRRVARLLESGTHPRKILAVTFTRNAARALLDDLHQLGVKGCERIVCGTLHSFCFGLLAKKAVFVFLGRNPRPLVYFLGHGVAQFEAAPLLRDIEGFGGARDCTKRIRAFEAAWARLQSEDPGWPQDPVDNAFHQALLEWLKFHEAILIGELVPEALRFIRNNPASDVLSQYKHVIVDEYQDLNKAEQVLLDELSGRGKLAIVGDVDQSVYSFRYAHPDGIAQFGGSHPNCLTRSLDDCRRCPTRVVAIADSLIRKNHPEVNTPRLLPHKGNPEGEIQIVQWRTMEDEAAGIAAFVEELVEEKGISPGDILVLSPRRLIGYAIRDGLREQGVPVHSFYHEEMLEPKEAQEAFTLLNLAVEPYDRVSLRWWLGLGSPTWNRGEYERLVERCKTTGKSPREALEQVVSGGQQISRTTRIVARFKELLERLKELEGLDPSGYVNALFPDGDERTASLRENALLVLEAFASEEDTMELSDLLSGLKTRITQPEMPEQGDFVRVMSLHKSKGLTSRAVIVAGCVEGLIPLVSDEGSAAEQEASLREQRRLFYVALTRCREVLMVSSFLRLPRTTAYQVGAQVREGYGSMVSTIASRFLDELGAEAPTAQMWEVLR